MSEEKNSQGDHNKGTTCVLVSKQQADSRHQEGGDDAYVPLDFRRLDDLFDENDVYPLIVVLPRPYPSLVLKCSDCNKPKATYETLKVIKRSVGSSWEAMDGYWDSFDDDDTEACGDPWGALPDPLKRRDWRKDAGMAAEEMYLASRLAGPLSRDLSDQPVYVRNAVWKSFERLSRKLGRRHNLLSIPPVYASPTPL